MELKGIFYEGDYTAKGKKAGMRMHYKVYIPHYAEGKEDLGLILMHDGFHDLAAEAAELNYIRGVMPACVLIGMWPGSLPTEFEGGFERGMRLDNYDIYDRSFPDYVADELLPHIIAAHDLKISEKPDMHLVMGGSSGGISAWNIAWFRPDCFRRVYMSSPSFLAMTNGRDLPSILRKFETKPIRVVSEFGEDEPDEYFGSSFVVADDAARALKYANYDCQLNYYPGESHCSRYFDVTSMMRTFAFLWNEWEMPIEPKGNSHRFDKVFTKGETWEKIETYEFKDSSSVYCELNGFTYKAEGNVIYAVKDGEKKAAFEAKGTIDTLAISSDGWRLYFSGKALSCLYATSILKDGSLEGSFIIAMPHRHTDFEFPGICDMAVDSHDRIFTATEMGILAVRSWGLIDAIAPLPCDVIPEKIDIFTENEKTYIAVSAKDAIYKREIVVYNDKEEKRPFPNGYYD